MAILKTADCKLVEIEAVENNSAGFIRTAATKLMIDTVTDCGKLVKAEMAKHKSALFFRAKAIKADEVNSNGDYFDKEELKRAAHSFVGVPFYTNHNNQDIENARGKIIWSEWNENENSIYVIGYIDREAYPWICRGIEQEIMSGVSMGAINADA